MCDTTPAGWKRVSLGDLGRFTTSSVDKLTQPGEQPVQLINYMDVYRHRRIDRSIELMQVTASEDEAARYQVQLGDILFTPSSETPDDIGHSAVVADDLPGTLHSYHTVRLRPDSRSDLDLWFRGWMANNENVLRYFANCAAGSTRYTLGLGRFASATLDLPPISEQRRIAEILSTLDEAIEQTEALIAKHQQIKAGLMHDLFTRGITPDGHLRPAREQTPDLYKESPLGWIPKEWDAAILSDRGRSGRAHLKTGPFGSALKIEHWVEEGHPVITIGALGEGEFLQSELLFVSDFTAQRLREYQLELGDVVFSRVADVGRSAVIMEQHKGWLMSSNLMRISLDQDKVRAAFLQAQLAHDSRVRAQIRATVNAGGRDVANSQILNRLLFAWPQLDEQTRLLDRIVALDNKREAETTRLDNLIKQKYGLMHDLLTGRVRVKVAESKEAMA